MIMASICERTETRSHGGATGFQPPAGVRLDRIPPEKSIGSMLLSGELDATLLYLPDVNLVDRSREDLSASPLIRTLFPDPQAEGARYYQKTGFYHINHGVVVRRSILEQHPWVALELFDAFKRSKEIVYERARRSASAYLYFPGKDAQEQQAVIGEDPYPLGLRAMGRNVERAIQGSLEQGLLTKPLALEDIYYRTTLNT